MRLIFMYMTFLWVVNSFSQTSQEIHSNFWITDGDISKIIEDSLNKRVYIGGNFKHVGPKRANGSVVSYENGKEFYEVDEPNNYVQTVISDNNGGWYIGGSFNRIGDSLRSGIAQIDNNGKVTPFHIDVSGNVTTLCLKNNILYIGGNNLVVNGEVRYGLAAVDVVNKELLNWTPLIDDAVMSILIDENQLYIGGVFNSVNGENRTHLASFHLNTWNLSSLNLNIQGYSVVCFERDEERIYFGGEFNQINGQTRNNIASFEKETGIINSWNPNAGFIVNDILVHNGYMYTAGSFHEMGDQPRSRLAQLHLETGETTGWNPGANSDVHAIAIKNDEVYFGGDFTEIGGLTRYKVASFKIGSSIPNEWNPTANNSIYDISTEGNKLYIAGAHSSIGGVLRNGLAALDIKTGEATNWDPKLKGIVENPIGALPYLAARMELYKNKLYVSGPFKEVYGLSRKYFAEIDLVNDTVTELNLNPNNRVDVFDIYNDTLYMAGLFTNIGGEQRTRIAAVDLNSRSVTSWYPGDKEGVVYKIKRHGNIVFLGCYSVFTTILGSPKNALLAFDSNSGNEINLNIPVNGFITDIEISNEHLYLAGSFDTIMNETRSGIAEIDMSDNTLTSFNPEICLNGLNCSGGVRTIELKGDNIYCGGIFQGVNGYLSPYLTVLNLANGTIVANEYPAYTNFEVNDIEIGSNKIYIGGKFFLPRPRLMVYGMCEEPDVPLIETNSDTIMENDSVSLFVASGNLNSAATWVWYRDSCQSNIIGYGDTLKDSPTSSGYYYLAPRKGCSDNDVCERIYIHVLPSQVENFVFYPNPTSGDINLKLNKVYPFINVSVNNISGQLIEELQFENVNNINFSLEGASGVYIINVAAENISKSFKVIKN